MTLDPPVLLVIALAAFVVAASAARRSGEHADRLAGRRPAARAARRGPLGAVVDLVDQSVVAYDLRRSFRRSTATRADRSAHEAQAALIARAEEIRLHRTGASPVRPAHLVVAGRAGPTGDPRRRIAGRPSSTLAFELLTAIFAFVVVVGVVVAIWPREPSGGVLSATATPVVSAVPSASGGVASPAP